MWTVCRHSLIPTVVKGFCRVLESLTLGHVFFVGSGVFRSIECCVLLCRLYCFGKIRRIVFLSSIPTVVKGGAGTHAGCYFSRLIAALLY